MSTQPTIYETLYKQAQDLEDYYRAQGRPGNRMYLSGVDLAKVIRFELKRAFPGVKFSVTAPHGEVRVSWTDGPTEKQVGKLIGHFEGKGFDGSIDLEYHYRHAITPKGIVRTGSTGTTGSMGSREPWAEPAPEGAIEINIYSYLFTNRHLTDETVSEVVKAINARFGWNYTAEQYNSGRVEYHDQHYITQALRKIDLYDTAKGGPFEQVNNMLDNDLNFFIHD